MLKLNDRKWKEFKIESIFKSIDRGKVSNLRNISNGKTPIIAAAGVNDGLACFSDDESAATNGMTISLNGVGTGTAFVHNYFFNLNSDCGLVKTKEDLNIYILRFISVAINKNKCKFNYGYKANENRLLRQTIMLLVNKKGNIDYTFMEQFIKEREEIKRKDYLKYVKKKIDKIATTIRKTNRGG